MRTTAMSWAGALSRGLFLDRQGEFWLSQIDPMRSLTEIRARVVDIVQETHNTKTFILTPNSLWRGHRAGQYVPVEVEIDGTRIRRCYSISSPPPTGTQGAKKARISITVKRVPGGRLSNFLHDRVKRSDVLRLGAAAGDFVLPNPTPERLLLLSGGSGITPAMSILRTLAANNAIRDLVFVHHARSEAEVIFGAELRQLAAAHPGLSLHLCLDDDPAGTRGFDEARLPALVPDFADRLSFVCAPAPLMDRAEKLWEQHGIADQLCHERFVAKRAVALPLASDGRAQVTFTHSERTHTLSGEGSLLEQLEQAGERPAHGCRIGICQSCKCIKRSGAVQNLVTGELSTEPDEEIQLCITAPRSDIELDL